MSFSNLFTKLSDVEEKRPREGTDIKVEARSSRKRKPQQQPGSYAKRQCLRSFAADPTDVRPEEQPRASDAQRHWTRSSKESRPGGSGARANNRAFRSNGNNKGNTSNMNNQKRQNRRRKEQENSQRYRHSHKDRRGKNVDFTQPRQRYMTQEFKDQHVVEVDGRLLCKYFILGRCTKGEECQLLHAEGSNDMIKDACKFYIQGNCYKGATCPYMHQSIPCKFFHKYEKCTSDNCRFSHDPLTDLTQKLLDEAIQRENELADLSKKAEEPVCQTTNEEQNTNEDIVIPAVRPSFYQSSQPAAEDETLPPHNEPQSDDTEEHSAPQTDCNTEPEETLDQPGTVCYSVEAVLGPQLFKPVLYTASNKNSARSPPKTTETVFNPVNAPYSVANVLRSPSGYTSHLCAAASTSREPKATQMRTTDDKSKVSYQTLFNKPSSFHVTAASGSYDNLHKAPGGSTVNCDGKKTQEGARVTANLTQVTADYKRERPRGSSASQQCQTPGERGKLLECGQDLARYTSSVNNSLPSKQETTKTSLKEQSSHETKTVSGKRQDDLLSASLPPPRERNASWFSSLFGNLKSDSDLTSSACSVSDKRAGKVKKSDACSEEVNQEPKPDQFTETARKGANSSSCSNQETSRDCSQKPVSFSNLKVKHKKNQVESTKTKSFQSLFTTLSANVDQTFADTVSGKAAASTAKEFQKSNCERQKATGSCQFMDNTLKMKKTATPETQNKNDQRPLPKKDCSPSTKTPSKSFQSLFANLLPNSEAASSACENLSDKPVVPSAQNVEKLNCGFDQASKAGQFPRSKTETTGNTDANRNKMEAGLKGSHIEISSNSCLKPVAFSSKPNSKEKQDANAEKPKTSMTSFQSLFSAPLNESTAENDSKMMTKPLQFVDGKLSQSKTSETGRSQKTVCVKESKYEPKEETVSNKVSARQPHTGSFTLGFKTLFQQLRPFEQQ